MEQKDYHKIWIGLFPDIGVSQNTGLVGKRVFGASQQSPTTQNWFSHPLTEFGFGEETYYLE